MKEKATQFVGAAIIVIVAVVVVVGLVYVLTGAVSANVLRWWAATATLALPVTVVVVWRLATNAAREHLSGFDRGVGASESVMTHVGRGLSAAASIARTAARNTTPVSHDDLLPKVGTMQIIDAPRGGGEIDL